MCLVSGAAVLSLRWMILPATQMQKQGLGFEFQICCASKRSRGKNEDAQNSAQDHTKMTEQNPAFDLLFFSSHSFLYCCQSRELSRGRTLATCSISFLSVFVGIFLSAHPYPGGQSQEQIMWEDSFGWCLNCSVSKETSQLLGNHKAA